MVPALAANAEMNGDDRPVHPGSVQDQCVDSVASTLLAPGDSVLLSEPGEQGGTPRERADWCKGLANKKFAEGKYEEASKYYTAAIELDGTNPIYFCNRAQARIKLELFVGALQDANKALELDPTSVKAKFRRATSQWMLGNLREAVADLTAISKLSRDRTVVQRLADLRKEFARIEFEKAIHVEETKQSLEALFGNIDFVKIEEDYNGPILNQDDEVTVQFVDSLIDFLRAQKKLHKKCLYYLLIKVRKILSEEKNIVDIHLSPSDKLTVCGDVHGQYYDLLNIFEINGKPTPTNKYLFNGDFVDRGSFSVECAITLLAYKCLYPTSMYISRGNHETEDINIIYGFKTECNSKYTHTVFRGFTDVFEALPLGHLIMDKILVIHGGLFSIPGVTIDQLQKLDRFRQPDDEITKQLLWSDPKASDGISESYRGIGIQFGPDITKEFCKLNKLKCVIRSHEMKTQGYQIDHDAMCITVFSAPNYCDRAGNDGAFIEIDCNLSLKFRTFSAVPHPPAPSMMAVNPFKGMGY